MEICRPSGRTRLNKRGAPFLLVRLRRKEDFMSVQTILAAGFLFLGGVLLHCLSWLGYNYIYFSYLHKLGIILAVIGVIPLLWHLLYSLFSIYKRLFLTKPTDKEGKTNETP